MNDSKFREQLIEQESLTPELETKYRKRLNEMIEKPLGPGMRTLWILSAIMGLGFFILFSGATIATFVGEEPGDRFPMAGKLMFAAGALFGLGWAVYGFTIAKKGAVSLNLYRNEFYDRMTTVGPGETGIAWAFLVIMMVCCLMSAESMQEKARSLENETQGIMMMLGGIKMILGGMVGLLMFGVPLLIISGQTRSELKVREQILRLELHVAEISEHLRMEK